MPLNNNSIALAKRYAPLLDEVYKKASVTSILDTPADLIQWSGADTALIYTTEMDGLADYNRNSGYVGGDVNGSWTPYQLAYSRGRSLMVDSMDSEETLDLAFGTLASEFVRTKEVPEVDAYTFAKICGTTGISAATPANIDNVTDILKAIDDAQAQMDDDEVPYEGRIAFVSTKAYYALKDKLTRFLMNDQENVQRNVEMLDSLRIIPVPVGRFNTAIDLLDGTTSGQEAGGYSNVPASGSSYAINFLIVHPSAIMKVMKHRVPRIFTPDVVQEADAYKFNIRLYGDTFVKANKVKGVYLHRAATANS